MAVIKTRGIIIKRVNLGEADKIITLITKDRGKIRVVAKGIRKPKAKLVGFLDLFHYNEYLIAEGRNLDIITGASTIESWPGINLSLRHVALAYYVAETIDKLIEETQEISNVFDLIYFTFKAIHQNIVNLDVLKSFFEINLLGALGFKPELDKCVECNQPIKSQAWFSFILGGVLDASHKHSDSLSLRLNQDDLVTLRSLRIDNARDFALVEQVTKINSHLSKVCSGFLNHIIDQRIKSQEFLAEMIDF